MAKKIVEVDVVTLDPDTLPEGIEKKVVEAEPQFGKFNAGDAAYDAYAKILNRALEEPFVLLVK